MCSRAANIAALCFLFSAVALAVPKPKGWWCRHLFGEESGLTRVSLPNGEYQWVKEDAWTPDRIRSGFLMLHALNVPLSAGYLQRARDAHADSFLIARLGPGVTMSRLAGAAIYRYHSIGAAALMSGIFVQDLTVPEGADCSRPKVLNVLAKLRAREVKAEDLLKDRIPEFAAITQEEFGVQLPAPFFWAFLRRDFRTLTDGYRASMPKAIREIPIPMAIPEAQHLVLDRHEALRLMIHLIEIRFRVQRHRAISSLRDESLAQESWLILQKVVTSQDLKQAAITHFGSWSEMVGAAEMAMLSEIWNRSEVEVGYTFDGDGVLQRVQTARESEAPVAATQSEFLSILELKIAKFDPRHREAARALIKKILASYDIPSSDEIRHFLKFESGLDDRDTDQVFTLMKQVLAPAA